MLRLIVMLSLITLIFSGCKHSQKVSETAKDSLVYIEKSRIDTLYIPLQSAEIGLTPALLRDTIWTYLERSEGRAKVQVVRLKDTVMVRAICDSVIHPVISTDRYRFQSSEKVKAVDNSEKIKSRKPLMWAFLAVFLAFIIGLLIRV